MTTARKTTAGNTTAGKTAFRRPTRRNALAAALAGAILAVSPLASLPALAQAAVVGAIRVDVSRLVEQGWGPNAAAIKAGLERELALALGPAFRRGAGPLLFVKVNGIFMPSYAGGGGGGRFGGGGGSNDSFDSVATLIGPDNRVLATYPILSSLSSGYSGAWYLPDIDQRRINALIQTNAAWIKRYVVG
ncbi:hypothetical protein [Bosea lathyri]|uniref:Uncharacterized protein n=1 Tax=Bosea lathyri TaxID=1036778 RepID=A0A1H6DDL3_9HYPH|nr:hypothetical protein [Bosea lathyri]SEG83350.1 hypothetical protein SAMN04488115_12250 [Bosea lathyri]